MKYLFFALSSFFFANVNSQCIVDAGDDIHFCLNNTYSLDSIILSPNLVNVQLPLTSISWKDLILNSKFSFFLSELFLLFPQNMIAKHDFSPNNGGYQQNNVHIFPQLILPLFPLFLPPRI